jgi:hypothetical protein
MKHMQGSRHHQHTQLGFQLGSSTHSHSELSQGQQQAWHQRNVDAAQVVKLSHSAARKRLADAMEGRPCVSGDSDVDVAGAVKVVCAGASIGL